MKKLVVSIFALSVLCATSFAKGFFEKRFFEMKTGVSVDFSNNLFSCNDFFQRDLVIDLKKISDECPEKGFGIRADVNPLIELNLNVLNIELGLSTGMDIYEKFEIGKDLFDFLGKGNSIGQTLDINFKNSTDIFYYTEAKVGFSLGKLKFLAKPAMFIPLLSIQNSGGNITVLNTSDGLLDVNMNVNMDIYSVYSLKSVDGNIGVDTDSLKGSLISGCGFDVGGTVTYQWSDSFALDAVCRFPLIPGRLYNKASVSGGTSYKMNIMDFENSEKKTKEPTVTNEDSFLALNRPLKIGVYANKNLLGTLFTARAGLGLGIQRPFCDGAFAYPEYYLGIGLNLLNIVKVGLSTEYRDQLFIHQIGTTLNVRVLQLDIGVSSQSATFKKSFEVAGVGAYAYITMGF